MQYKSKYKPEEIKEKLEYIKSNIGADDKISYTEGVKYNIWRVYNGFMEPEHACWVLNLLEPSDSFCGTVFGKQQTIFMWFPEFDCTDKL
jgi:hypothetical protein